MHQNILKNTDKWASIQWLTVPTVKQYLLRVIALYLAANFQKGINGDANKDTIGKIDVKDFDLQKKKFIELIGRFLVHKGELTLPHIAFCNISTKEWGVAAYKHMDHHLRQFGV
jgi:hypothetical protein